MQVDAETIDVLVRAEHPDEAHTITADAAASAFGDGFLVCWVTDEQPDAADEDSGAMVFPARIAVAGTTGIGQHAALEQYGVTVIDVSDVRARFEVSASSTGNLGLTFAVSLIPGGFGDDDYESPDGVPVTLTATVAATGRRAGRLDAYLYSDGSARIHWLEVDDGHARQGVASSLLDVFEQAVTGWDTNGVTTDGQALLDRRD